MLGDIVIDTNVFLHAADPRQGHQAQCLRLITAVRNSTTLLRVDGGINPTRPLEGFIMTEYLERLTPGTVGFEVLAFLLPAARVVPCSRTLTRSAQKRLEQLVSNKGDRKFVAVARNSTEKILVSHDFNDFSNKTRQAIERHLSVRVVEAHTGADLV